MASHEIETMLATLRSDSAGIQPLYRPQVIELLDNLDERLRSCMFDTVIDVSLTLVFQLLSAASHFVLIMSDASDPAGEVQQLGPEDSLFPDTETASIASIRSRSQALRRGGGIAKPTESQRGYHALVRLTELADQVITKATDMDDLGLPEPRQCMELLRTVLPDANARFWARSFGLGEMAVPLDEFCDKLVNEAPHVPAGLAQEAAAQLATRADLNDDNLLDVIELAMCSTPDIVTAMEDVAKEREKLLEEEQRRQASEVASAAGEHGNRRGHSASAPGGSCSRCARLEAELCLKNKEIEQLKRELLKHKRGAQMEADLGAANSMIRSLRVELAESRTPSRQPVSRGGSVLEPVPFSSASVDASEGFWAKTAAAESTLRLSPDAPSRGQSIASFATTVPVGNYVVASTTNMDESGSGAAARGSGPTAGKLEADRLNAAVSLFNQQRKSAPTAKPQTWR